MKKTNKHFIWLVFALCAVISISLTACSENFSGSLKEITDPYLTMYECSSATLGEDNLLEELDYIRITLLDKNTMEFSFKKKGCKPVAKKFNYIYREDTHELSAEASILGMRIKESVIIENGKFTVSTTLLGKPLIMKFSS